jgi:hypothetical protein
MRTPAGKECQYYFEDFHRGRNVQKCRLIERNPESAPWTPGLCHTCPVPAILRANACPHLVLDAKVSKRLFGLVQRVEVTGWCSEHFLDVEHPAVGCGHCHEYRGGPSILDLVDEPGSKK